MELLRVGAWWLWDNTVRPRARRAGQVPGSAELLTRSWLTSVLCAGHPGAVVEDFRVFGGSDGTTSRRQLTVTYNDEGVAQGLPEDLFTKSTVKLKNRLMCGSIGLLASETGFYNDIRPRLDIEAPRSRYADYQAKSFRMFLILDDLVSSGGATFLDPRAYIDRSMAEQMVDLMAGFHAPFWASLELDRMPWLETTERWQRAQNEKIDLERYATIGLERARSVLPQKFYSQRERVYPAIMRASAVSSAAPLTVVHSDLHIGNWYQLDNGLMGLCDWQATGKASWALDFGYALGSALTTEDRRDWEEGLLTRYLDRLKDAGVDPPAFDDAWYSYRQQAFRGLANWLPTLGAAGGMLPDMQPDEISLINIERMAQMVVDLGSIDVVLS